MSVVNRTPLEAYARPVTVRIIWHSSSEELHIRIADGVKRAEVSVLVLRASDYGQRIPITALLRSEVALEVPQQSGTRCALSFLAAISCGVREGQSSGRRLAWPGRRRGACSTMPNTASPWTPGHVQRHRGNGLERLSSCGFDRACSDGIWASQLWWGHVRSGVL